MSTERESKISLEAAERNILAKINNFNNQFLQQVEASLTGGTWDSLTWCHQVSQEVRLLLRRIKQDTTSQLTEL